MPYDKLVTLRKAFKTVKRGAVSVGTNISTRDGDTETRRRGDGAKGRRGDGARGDGATRRFHGEVLKQIRESE